MKILQLTDLHNEFKNPLLIPLYEKEKYTFLDEETWEYIKSINGSDILILSGDIDNYKNIPTLLENAAKHFEHVIHINGNHEYYGREFTYGEEYIKSNIEHIKNAHHLNRESINIEGYRFIGCTLWTDLNKNNPLYEMQIKNSLNDFNRILYNGNFFSTNDWLNEFEKDFSFLQEELIGKDNSKTVVITHHAPTIESAMYYGKMTESTYGFGSELTEFIMDTQPKYWFFGHTHTPFAQKIGNTELINNFSQNKFQNVFTLEKNKKKLKNK